MQTKSGTPPPHLQNPNITMRYQLFGHIVERIVQTKTIQLYPVPAAVCKTGRQTDRNKLETISFVKETFHNFEDDRWIYEIYEQDILKFDILKQSTQKTYLISLFP